MVAAEFKEVGSGKRADRPQVAAALIGCRVGRAGLVVEGTDEAGTGSGRRSRKCPIRATMPRSR